MTKKNGGRRYTNCKKSTAFKVCAEMRLDVRMKVQEEEKKVLEMSEYGKRRLLTYAESFRELAKTMDEEFEISETQDRDTVLEAKGFWENCEREW